MTQAKPRSSKPCSMAEMLEREEKAEKKGAQYGQKPKIAQKPVGGVLPPSKKPAKKNPF